MFGFPVVQKQDGSHLVQFSNGPDHLKTKLLPSLDHFINKHNFSLKKWSRLSKSLVFHFHWKTEQNGGHFDNKSVQTDYHWKTKQTPTI